MRWKHNWVDVSQVEEGLIIEKFSYVKG